MPVEDLDGKSLGRVTDLHDDGFHVLGGLPILFRRDVVARYDEVRSLRDGTLVLARSDSDFLELGLGRIPRSWRIPSPPDYPSAATPGEARSVFEDLAAGALVAGGTAPGTLPDLGGLQPEIEAAPEQRREERRPEPLGATPPYP